MTLYTTYTGTQGHRSNIEAGIEVSKKVVWLQYDFSVPKLTDPHYSINKDDAVNQTIISLTTVTFSGDLDTGLASIRGYQKIVMYSLYQARKTGLESMSRT